MPQSDVLVIGSGIAGLSFAIKVAELRSDLSITMICKTEEGLCNTALAQGGIAVVSDFENDSFEQHIHDTMMAGGELSERRIVENVIKEAPARLLDLLKWGVTFDKNVSGAADLHLEGGHTARRILHHCDRTGFEIETKLLERVAAHKQIKLERGLFALGFITGCRPEETVSDYCSGVYVFDPANGISVPYTAGVVMLAGGGCGSVFSRTTNPPGSTGDCIAMAIRAGLKVRDMRFMQFHPTVLTDGTESDNHFLISEAVRGAGAHLLNSKGERFMLKKHSAGELACRDIVSAAMREEMMFEKSDYLYLDCRHFEAGKFRNGFPGIYEELTLRGIDPSVDLIPVAPAAHYQCGGICVGENGETELAGLFASGECMSSGLHGRNRLASNSLLEALVYSHRAACHVVSCIDAIPEPVYPSLKRIRYETCRSQEFEEKIERIRKAIRHLADDLFTNRGDTLALGNYYTQLVDIRKQVSGYLESGTASVALFEAFNMCEIVLYISSELAMTEENHLHNFRTLNG